MKNLCSNSEYKGCPASSYMRCRAYKEGLNCWEVRNKPCCPDTDSSTCTGCKVYIKCRSGAARPPVQVIYPN